MERRAMKTGEAQGRLAGRRVLVVEDQYLVAEEMRRMVSSLGGEVLGPVARAAPALKILAAEPVDLAVLDINLGPENAYPLAAELMRRDVPFFFATGCEPWVVADQFRQVPRVDKPLTAKTFTDALQRAGL
jgi:DNA-binding NarL/FixJ family response regulator